jgi:hypothetical protein
MITVRLYVDHAGTGWALVRCNACTIVDKYSALDAFDAPVRCQCGETMTVRNELMAAARKHRNSPEALRPLSGPLALA